VAAGTRSTFFVPPVLLRRLSASPALAGAPVDRIGTVLVGAAPVSPDDLRAGVRALGPRVWNGYGQGESPCTITANPPAAIAAAVAEGDERVLGSVGVPRWATRVRVVDGDDRVLPFGEVGEVMDLVAAGTRSTFFVPPTLLRRLSASPAVAAGRVDRIGTVLVGAAPVHPDDLRAGVGALGPRVWNGYGQGESPCTITANPPAAIAAAAAAGDERVLGSVGVARWATRVRVVDDADRELPHDEVGEVIVAAPTVMAGYLDDPEASATALRNGWLHTGDLGRVDADGHLTLVDRAKDVVITGGHNVDPREVEDVLIGDVAVAEVAVVGLPDPEWGEVVAAFVVAEPGATLDAAALDQRCQERIARHKRPRSYHVLAELPRNSAGKILKKTLRESLAHGPR
ncbi:MAG: long-chain acyl-CoA synthetase, partial [Solirubrobacteraceae bacterium]|nr:long-chain acyl-CoA synthetase [Solirubrobacteraceae bacterium]